MTADEITQAQAVLREFGYDVHEHCRKTSRVLIDMGLLAEAVDTISASRELLDILKCINGKDFLLTGQENPG